MNLTNKIKLIKENLNDYFKDRDETLFAYIFGSTVTETANKLSDIDIAIYINEEKINEKERVKLQVDTINRYIDYKMLKKIH